MYKIKVDKLLGLFSKINKLSDDNIVEISIKKARINFEFKDGSIVYSKILLGLLEDPLINEENSYMTSWEGNIRLTCDTHQFVNGNNATLNIPKDSLFKDFFDLIEELGDHICQCPSLEYVVAENFIKVYIDKPSMSINDFIDLKEVFGQNYTIELSKQRPYCLFIAEFDKHQTHFEVSENASIKNDTIAAALASKEEEEESNDVLTSDIVRKIL